MMQICRVVGSAVSTIKDSRLRGYKLLVCLPINLDMEQAAEPFLAVDTVGAGEGDIVSVVRGSAARKAAAQEELPADAAVVAVIDTIEALGRQLRADRRCET